METSSNQSPEKRRRGRPRKPERFHNQFQFTLLLPRDLVTVLDEEAQRTGAGSRSEIVRRACAEYLRRAQRRRERARGGE